MTPTEMGRAAARTDWDSFIKDEDPTDDLTADDLASNIWDEDGGRDIGGGRWEALLEYAEAYVEVIRQYRDAAALIADVQGGGRSVR